MRMKSQFKVKLIVVMSEQITQATANNRRETENKCFHFLIALLSYEFSVVYTQLFHVNWCSKSNIHFRNLGVVCSSVGYVYSVYDSNVSRALPIKTETTNKTLSRLWHFEKSKFISIYSATKTTPGIYMC